MIKNLLSGKRKFLTIPALVLLAFPLLPFLVGLPIAWLIYKKVSSSKLRYGLLTLLLMPTLLIGTVWVAAIVSPPKAQEATTTTESTNTEVKSAETTTPEGTSSPTPTETPTVTTTPTPTKTPTPTAKLTPKPTTTVKPTAKPTAQPTTNSTSNPSGDKDCKDFATYAAAQAYFNSKGGSKTNNVDNLDSDGDGVACENLP